MDDRINLAEKFALLGGDYQPAIVGYMNDYKLVVVKTKGEFVWHKHDETDELFLVVAGRLSSSCATATSSWSRESCSWSPAASSTAPRPKRRPTSS